MAGQGVSFDSPCSQAGSLWKGGCSSGTPERLAGPL